MSRFGTGNAVSNTLVTVAPADQQAPFLRATARLDADFIAQLIATSAQVPQTRARRRADPQEAIAAYSALDRSPPAPGKTLSRSL
jgi:hypothetical protein